MSLNGTWRLPVTGSNPLLRAPFLQEEPPGQGTEEGLGLAPVGHPDDLSARGSVQVLGQVLHQLADVHIHGVTLRTRCAHVKVEARAGRGEGEWALLDSNQGPIGYEPTALTAELRAPSERAMRGGHCHAPGGGTSPGCAAADACPDVPPRAAPGPAAARTT